MSAGTAARRSLLYFAGSVIMLTVAYPWLGNHIEPRVFGMPWSLVYVLGWVVANGAVLAWLHVRDDEEDPAGRLE